MKMMKFKFLYLSRRHETSPIMVDTTCQWNQTGTMLVIAGLTSSRGEHLDVLVNVVQCFSPMGDHLRTLKVPGNSLPRMLVLCQDPGQLMLDP